MNNKDDAEFLRALASGNPNHAASRLRQIAKKLESPDKEPEPEVEKNKFVSQIPKDGPSGPTPGDQARENQMLKGK
jgi:hypothetical protein